MQTYDIYRMNELIKILNNATKAYEEGHPIMSDREWDDLYFELVELEKELEEKGFKELISDISPTQTIVSEVVSQLEKSTHTHPMLSLAKTKELEEIEKFIKKKDCLAMAKMDGLTISLTYKLGRLVKAETRGNGTIGENVLHNVVKIPSIPKNINYYGTLTVDGEIISTYDNFNKFNKDYKNPRNFAAGSIRLLDSKECEQRGLTFVAWEVLEDLGFKALHHKLNIIRNFGFITVPYIFLSKYADLIDLGNTVTTLQKTVENLSYPIDGLVFKYDDLTYGRSLGSTAHHFNNAIAYKFYDETYETRLEAIEWSMGRTGVLTPIARFNPIDIDGTEVSRASLHNVSVMEELLGTPYSGQKIWVAKMNQIIPQIVEAEKLGTF